MTSTENQNVDVVHEAEEDINDVFEDIFLTEERIIDEHFHHGLEDGRQEQSVQEAEEYGYKKETTGNEKAQTIVQELLVALEKFPHGNDPDVDLFHELQRIRNAYRRLCALLKHLYKYTQANDLSF